MNATPAGDPDRESPGEHSGHDPYAALRGRDFRLMLCGNLLSMLGLQALSTAVGWEVFDRTNDVLSLSWVGLAQVLPVMGLFLPAGAMVDRANRKRTVFCAVSVMGVCALLLGWLSFARGPLWWLYALLALLGAGRAFAQPARSALISEVVEPAQFANAVGWSSGVFQFTMVAGPALAGWLIYLTGSAAAVYFFAATCCACYLALLVLIRTQPRHARGEPLSLRALGAGVAFVFANKVLLAALCLDMFAVLLGGATALLPVYAKDVLQTGERGYGWLRAAPGLGAVVMSLWMTHRPPLTRAGRTLLISVALFGLFTVGFGWARSFPLSFALLLALGAADMVSVVIRNTLVQLLTPDAMRGRVSAVNGLFINISNELGEVESGAVAHWARREADPAFGPTFAVVSGGLGTLLVVAAIAWLCPPLRRYGRLETSRRR